jgi:hypothetical protein
MKDKEIEELWMVQVGFYAGYRRTYFPAASNSLRCAASNPSTVAS